MNEAFLTRCQSSATPSLLLETGPARLVRLFPLDGPQHPTEIGSDPLLVGRDAVCGLVLADDSVSRRHAIIEFHDSRHSLTDLGSTNGTLVNDELLSMRRMLEDGDRVQFGDHVFKYLAAGKVEAQYHEVVFRLMTTDGLTGAFNKRYFLDALAREIRHVGTESPGVSLLMMDLDHFKGVNDTYGHLAGDAILVEFVRRAKSLLRDGDILARYGGEEFAIILTQTTREEAYPVAERIRERIAADPVVTGQHSIPISVSIGLAHHPRSSPIDPVDLVHRADVLLYQAKQSGRNRVCL
jgi:diguanylate cyclase (GGDEF)-like protein